MNATCKRLVLVSIVLALLFFTGYLLHGSSLSRVCQPGLTLADFDFVYLGITYDEIVEEVGEPSAQGISMHKYELADCSHVVLRMSGEQLAGIWVQREDGTRVDFFTGETLPELRLEDFAFLERNMLYGEVISRVGEPNREGGSGFYRATYELSDGRTLILQLATRWMRVKVIHVVMDAWVGSEDGNAVNFFE